MADQLAITGQITDIFGKEEISDKFTKQEFIIETPDQYPQKIRFETVNDKTALLGQLFEGQSVKVYFNLRGNEYKGKVYNSLQAWKIDKIQ